jgi:hypothetical protein
VTVQGAGTCTISADQGGNGNYKPALTKTQSFIIDKANQIIAFGAAPSGVIFGDPPVTVSATSLSPTAPPSGILITFGSLTPDTCTNVGASVTLVGAGTCTIAANQTGDTNYNPAPQVTQDFNIAKAPVQFTAIDPLYFTSFPDTTTTVNGKLSRPGFPAVYPLNAPTIDVAPNSTTLTSGAPGGTDGAFSATGTTPAPGTYALRSAIRKLNFCRRPPSIRSAHRRVLSCGQHADSARPPRRRCSTPATAVCYCRRHRCDRDGNRVGRGLLSGYVGAIGAVSERRSVH